MPETIMMVKAPFTTRAHWARSMEYESMPFPQQSPRPFTKAGVEALNSNQRGVYGIFRSDAWIYVGRGDIRTRLLDHLNGGNALITRERPTHFVTEVTSNDEAREKALITELNPVANRKVG